MANMSYEVARRGPVNAYSDKRVRNAARRTAWRLLYDGALAHFNAMDPTDPLLAEECRRGLEDLARRAGMRPGKEEPC
jgi:hypothetical protein